MVKKKFSSENIDNEITSFISSIDNKPTSKGITPKKENEEKSRLSLYFPTDLLNKLTLLARAKNISRNQLMIELLEKSLDNPIYSNVLKTMLELENKMK